MYDLQWGQRTPGYLVFLLDQSGSMDRKNKEVVQAIQDALWECMSSCISGSKIKPRFCLSVITYGREVKTIIKNQWSDVDLFKKVKEARTNQTSFILPEADGLTPMDRAIQSAIELVKNWKSECEKKLNNRDSDDGIDGIPAPIVVNITDGMPEGHAGIVEDCKKAALELKNITTPDGNVVFLNLHLSGKSNDVMLQFPTNESELDGSAQANFLYEVSTSLDDSLLSKAKSAGLEMARKGSKGMVVNAKGDVIAKFIEFGSVSSM